MMTIDLCWQSLWVFAKEHQALTTAVFTSLAFSIFWLLRFLFGHKMVMFRCWLGLHRYEDWDIHRLDRPLERILEQKHPSLLPDAPATSQIVQLNRYCIDCPKQDPDFVEARLKPVADNDEEAERLVYVTDMRKRSRRGSPSGS